MELDRLIEVPVRCNPLDEEATGRTPPLLLLEGRTIDLEGPLGCEGSIGETLVPRVEVEKPERSGANRPDMLRPDPETVWR